MIDSADRFDRIRQTEFHELEDSAYLNAASLGPLPQRSRAAVTDYAARRARVQTMSDADFVEPAKHARTAAARLIGATPEEIALGPNTSFGINVAATGLQVPRGSIVLASEGEFPANVYPWMNRDRLRLELVPRTAEGWPDEDRLLERIAAGGVSILATSSVQFHTGFRANLERLGRVCRQHDTFLVVDAIQSLGCLPMDVRQSGADVVATGGHKWLCSPFGSGFAFVRREIQERLDPQFIGWYSMHAGREFEALTGYEWGFVPDASRYEVGTLAQQDLIGFAESVSVLLEAGVSGIRNHVDALLEPLRNWILEHPEVSSLSSFDPSRRSGIVSFRPPAVERVYRELQRAGVVCSVREGGIRIAAHLYNTSRHIELVLEVLETRAAEGWG
ncbi:MAG: aminotransferase class V-fold PLP-dependent enzyme [Gemmatimonas sp.]|nr:aminotransferase class V-fold PLP-dependent enzyme [Gemmatimonas sp.]